MIQSNVSEYVEDLLPFHCVPPTHNCEVFQLRGFVGALNSELNADYKITRLLERMDRSHAQPEFLMSDLERGEAVVEHKRLVWPENYISVHAGYHRFAETAIKILNPLMADFVGALEILEADVADSGLKAVELAQIIAERIESSSFRECGARTPIPWVFRRLSLVDLDFDEPRNGLCVRTQVSNESFLAGSHLIHGDELEELWREIARNSESVQRKFANHPGVDGYLVWSVHGAPSLDLETIVGLLRECSDPIANQTWIELFDPIDESGRFVRIA